MSTASDFLDAANDYVGTLEAEQKADNKAFYDGTGRARIITAVAQLDRLRDRLRAMQRG